MIIMINGMVFESWNGMLNAWTELNTWNSNSAPLP
jgi:hypothetical protein